MFESGSYSVQLCNKDLPIEIVFRGVSCLVMTVPKKWRPWKSKGEINVLSVHIEQQQ